MRTIKKKKIAYVWLSLKETISPLCGIEYITTIAKEVIGVYETEQDGLLAYDRMCRLWTEENKILLTKKK